ncbi:MAG: hypothetical protein QOE58_2110 [Actinomycetota bacterium]|nr:hypothetical protein [Actinomycetota bacterium]
MRSVPSSIGFGRFLRRASAMTAEGGGSLPRLTSNDPEPRVRSLVRDKHGRLWRRWPEGHWLREHVSGAAWDGNPASWSKVAGEYGPVTLVKAGKAPHDKGK